MGSATVALDGSGNVTASILYDPYGQARYTTGAMPGSRGYTGQHSDSTTGLDYYNARFYDPVAGQFVSADSVQDGLNRYMYVRGNPETRTDPTGHKVVCGDGGAGDSTIPAPEPQLSALLTDHPTRSTSPVRASHSRYGRRLALVSISSDIDLAPPNFYTCFMHCLRLELYNPDSNQACAQCAADVISSGPGAALTSIACWQCAATYGSRVNKCARDCHSSGPSSPSPAPQPPLHIYYPYAPGQQPTSPVWWPFPFPAPEFPPDFVPAF